MKDNAARRKAIADKLAADIVRLKADILRRREKLAAAKVNALAHPGRGRMTAGWFNVWDRHAGPIARAEGQLARAMRRAPIAHNRAEEAGSRARAAEAAKQRRDRINAGILRQGERLAAAGPHPQVKWDAERADEEKRLKKLKKQIEKRTRRDLTKHSMFQKPVTLPEPPKQPDLTEDEPPAPPPRDGLIPGTYRIVDPERLGALLDPEPLPAQWTPRHVGSRLIEAMDVVRRAPERVGPKGYGAMWPAYRHENGDLALQAGAGTLAIGRNAIRIAVGADEAARAQEALLWPMQFLSRCNAWALLALNAWASDPEATPEDPDAPKDMLKFIADCLNAAKEVVR